MLNLFLKAHGNQFKFIFDAVFFCNLLFVTVIVHISSHCTVDRWVERRLMEATGDSRNNKCYAESEKH